MSDHNSAEIFGTLFKFLAAKVRLEKLMLETAKKEREKIEDQEERSAGDQISLEHIKFTEETSSVGLVNAIACAEYMWPQMRKYDFANYQMDCVEDLMDLGLAKVIHENDPNKRETLYRTYDLNGWTT